MTDIDPSYCTGPNSLWNNAVAQGSAGFETSKAMPDGWGMPGETRSATIRQNAIEGLWLPLFIPEGCDGHVGQIDPDTGELLPEVVYYASKAVPGILDAHGPAHSSPDVDQARYDQAVQMGLETGMSIGGVGPYAREG